MSDSNMQQSIVIEDPSEGYASCPDTKRVYLEHSKDNQIRWMQKSEETIREFISKLPSFYNFLEAYSFLANKRHQIALELKQRTDDGRMDLYGVFRHEGDHYRQSVTAGDGEHFWKWQKNKIFELTYKLIKPLESIRIFDMQPGYLYEDKCMTCLKEKVIVDDRNATYYCISIKFPYEENDQESLIHSHTLALIELYDFETNKKFNLIRVEYTPVNDRNVVGNYLIANKYFQSMLNWKNEEGIEKFFMSSAKLAYFIAHLLPVKHGNSAIIEWMIRAIAFRNAINMGRFNYSEGISWDFKALLTPNLNEYVKWFCEKLFVEYTLIAHTNKIIEFTFDQSK